MLLQFLASINILEMKRRVIAEYLQVLARGGLFAESQFDKVHLNFICGHFIVGAFFCWRAAGHIINLIPNRLHAHPEGWTGKSRGRMRRLHIIFHPRRHQMVGPFREQLFIPLAGLPTPSTAVGHRKADNEANNVRPGVFFSLWSAIVSDRA